MASTSKNSICIGDQNFESVMTQWLHDVEDIEDSDAEAGNVSDPDYNSEHDTESELDISSEESDQSVSNERNQKALYGRNRYMWSAEEPKRNVRTPAHNIIVHLPGLKVKALRIGHSCTPLQIWECIFSEDMLVEVVTHTNEKIKEYRSRYADETRTELRDVSLSEMRAFIGLLYYTAIFKSNKENLESLFATDGTGRDIFRCTLSLKRILVLLICLRFDDSSTRNERLETDPAAAISNIFNCMIRNSQDCYCIGETACIDEMLLGFHGRCRFRMYMASKPVKYGLKIMILCDAKTHYLLNAYIYTGKGSDGVGLSSEEKKLLIPSQSVIRLARPIEGSCRNITADNYFSSIEVVNELKERKLTYVGTLKKNKREIPLEFLPQKNRREGSSEYGFTKDMTLVSYVPKKNKAVVLISSMHHCKSTDSETGKPEIISFYNQTKGGVDGLDQKCMTFSTSRRTCRWPMAIFFGILNIAGVNSHVLYSAFRDNSSISRFDFLKGLSRQLCEMYLNERLLNTRLPRELRNSIGRILNMPLPSPVHEVGPTKRKRCSLCPRSSDKKTDVICVNCNRHICVTCRRSICLECVDE